MIRKLTSLISKKSRGYKIVFNLGSCFLTTCHDLIGVTRHWAIITHKGR